MGLTVIIIQYQSSDGKIEKKNGMVFERLPRAIC
jgi:hypothetical protein